MNTSPPPIEWQRVINKLTYAATSWMIRKRGVDRDDPIIKGKGPADLAKEALIVVAEKYRLLSEDDILRVARRIMFRDFLDLVRSKEYRGRERLDGVTTEIDRSYSEKPTIQKELEDVDTIAEFYEIADGDQGLKDYIDAVVELNVYKREEIAEILGVSPKEVTNLQRRLRYQYLRREKKKEKMIIH